MRSGGTDRQAVGPNVSSIETIHERKPGDGLFFLRLRLGFCLFLFGSLSWLLLLVCSVQCWRLDDGTLGTLALPSLC